MRAGTATRADGLAIGRRRGDSPPPFTPDGARPMLTTNPLMAFLATANAEAAIMFYRDRLGLRLVEETEFALEFECGEAELTVKFVNELAGINEAELGVRLGITFDGELASGEIEFEDLPGPIGDGLLDVVVVLLITLPPVLIPSGAAGDDVIDGPIAHLPASVEVMMGTDGEDVFGGLSEDRGDGIAEPRGDIADVLFRLIRAMDEGDDELHLGVVFRGVDDLRDPGSLGGGGVFAVRVEEEDIADVIGVIGIVAGAGDTGVGEVSVVKMRAVEGEGGIAIGFVIADQGHDREVRGDLLFLEEVDILVLVERADVDLVTDIEEDIDRFFDGETVFGDDGGFRASDDGFVAGLVFDLVVADDEEP